MKKFLALPGKQVIQLSAGEQAKFAKAAEAGVASILSEAEGERCSSAGRFQCYEKLKTGRFWLKHIERIDRR